MDHGSDFRGGLATRLAVAVLVPLVLLGTFMIREALQMQAHAAESADLAADVARADNEIDAESTTDLARRAAALGDVDLARSLGAFDADPDLFDRGEAATRAAEAAAIADREAESAALRAFAAIAVSIVAAFAVAWSVVAPMRRLVSRARRIRAGDLSGDPLPMTGPTELVDAAGACNELVASLQLMERKTAALATGDFDADALSEPLPGMLGESLHRSVRVLSGSIEERERLQEKLAHQATHDTLTGIPNRAAAIDYLYRAVARARRSGELLAVIFLDLDSFKGINDTHGHAVGDEVLRATAQRMSASARDSDMLARLGGDEFLLIAENVSGLEQAAHIAQRAVSVITEPLVVDGIDLLVGACAGIALAQDGDDPLTLMRHADIAVYSAKEAGTGSVNVYDELLQRSLSETADVEEGLIVALESDEELQLEYQPIIDAQTGAMTVVEALLRWDRPGRGRIMPDDFIPEAESSNLIVDIDRWVLRRATATLASLSEQPALADVSVSVNISGRHLMAGCLVGDVAHALEASGLDPERLIVEITETVLLTDLTAVGEQLQAVRDLGVRVAIDDFGTGFTSLAHLRSLPIDEIKIDRSLVSGVTESRDDESLVQIVCDLARRFGVSTVAEGIETETQRDILTGLGCDSLQGYLFSAALPPEGLSAWSEARIALDVAGRH